jgi:ribonuclease D
MLVMTSPLQQQQQTSSGMPLSMPTLAPHHINPSTIDTKESTGYGGSSSSTWRNFVSENVREQIRTTIVNTLKTMKPNAPEKILEKLPGMAARIDENLFKVAINEQEYADTSTVSQRLSVIQQVNTQRLLQHESPSGSPRSVNDQNKVLPAKKALAQDRARFVYTHLQAWRQKLVNTLGIPPSEIVSNKNLAKVAINVPISNQELRTCGMEEQKIDRFGISLIHEIQIVLQKLPLEDGLPPKPQGPTEVGKHLLTSSSSGGQGIATKKRRTSSKSSLKMSTSGYGAGPITPTGTGASSPLVPPSALLFHSGSSTPMTGPTSPGLASLLPALNNAPRSHLGGRFSSALTQSLRPQLAQSSTSGDNSQDSMQILACEAEQLKKTSGNSSSEEYKKEIQNLRCLLHQSQEENRQLQEEIKSLKSQLERTIKDKKTFPKIQDENGSSNQEPVSSQ